MDNLETKATLGTRHRTQTHKTLTTQKTTKIITANKRGCES